MAGTEDEIVDLAVGHDALVAGAARDLVADVILRIDHFLNHGTPAQQMTILRAFATPLLRTAAATEDKSELDELRKEMRELHAAVMGEHDEGEDVSGTAEESQEYEALQDEPPVPDART